MKGVKGGDWDWTGEPHHDSMRVALWDTPGRTHGDGAGYCAGATGVCTTHPRPRRAASQSLPLGLIYMATCSGGPSSRGLPLVIDDGCRCTRG